ncbi:receptor-type tyrosine-protein phosphatase delta isoform X2 [Tribolium castaneum]|uniref:receptor-type tyrosine-protein phosphatase delta isoform X2 n=1 Tax=Tribolium castaneum TaxID=7070 RepID=UPI00077DD08D|nr:PREDICTED: receptor-type tyrosine-protein phosphatase delta-like isoform X2 [Tribolium castaneum]|eukprot:XP_015839778.1 PREDICTED: receptor-type tyrosine-protein phosphatase delta-like isoform X2 [Tribolium castaneum]
MTVSYEKIIGPTLILLICNVCSHCQVFFKETHPNQKLLLSTTKIAVPDEVQDLRAINHSDTSIHLIWKQPLQMNGDFIYYVVEYQIVSDVACKGNKVSKKFKLKTRETSINVQKLVPYANYFFKVFAVNTKSHGKLRAVYHSTRGSPLLKNEECPKLKNIITNDHHVEIRFSFIDCEKIKGPVSIKITAICAEVWCKNVTKEFKYNAEQNSFTLHRLFPFVKYNLTAKCCRNKQCYTIVKNQIFKIGAQSPGPVTNLSVFAKNDNSISIRWRKPHPPNGILDHYNISYFTTKESEAKSEIVMNSPCTLWTNFHCYTLNHLKADKKYFVQVRAKNIEPQTYGQLVEINAVTKIEASKPPLNLTVKWTLQNDLQLIWCHPIEANGYITHFNISVFSENQTENHIIHTLEVLNYSFTYIHIINQTKLIPSRNYTIIIRAFNGLNGNPATTADISPPVIPFFENEPKIVFTTDTTFIVETSKIRNNAKDFKLFLLVQVDTKNIFWHPEEIKQFEEQFDFRQIAKFQILYKCSNKINPSNFTIGKNCSVQNCTTNNHLNYFLKPEISYNISLLLINTYRNKSSYKLYSFRIYTSNSLVMLKAIKNFGLSLLFLMVIIVPGVIIYARKRKKPIIYPEIAEDYIPLREINIKGNLEIDSMKIEVSELENYIKESLKNGDLERQYLLIPQGHTKPCYCGALEANRHKNRYPDLFAYDHTRVVLRTTNDKKSDYINANYIDGYNMPRAYIATQGPKISTVDDFWRMIWQEIVQHIVMLANIYEQGKKKVEKYWPNPHEVLHYGKIKIQHFNIKVSTDFEHRIIKVTNQNITRDVHQYLFLSWQYLEVPFYSQSFITLLEKLQSIPLSTESPIVVHSSAGVGRTGTIILCDICLRMAAEENSVDIFGTLYQLRDQRPNLVKNVEQFKLAHLVILDYLVGRRTGTPCSKIEKTKNFLKSEELNTQLNYLKNIAWWDEMALHHLLSAIPAKIFNQFITIQQPECNMVGKFWKLVHEKEILLIVSLNNSKIWSFQETNLLNPVDYLMLKYIKTKSYKFYDIIILHMYIRDIKEYRVVEIVSVKEWPAKKLCPKNIVNFLSFWEKTYEKFKKSNQVLITCFDGVAACGLYIAMTFVLEKIKLEHICDVCQGVRVVRCINSEFVTSEKQLAFMYKAAMIYVNKFQLYSNFK